MHGISDKKNPLRFYSLNRCASFRHGRDKGIVERELVRGSYMKFLALIKCFFLWLFYWYPLYPSLRSNLFYYIICCINQCANDLLKVRNIELNYLIVNSTYCNLSISASWHLSLMQIWVRLTMSLVTHQSIDTSSTSLL